MLEELVLRFTHLYSTEWPVFFLDLRILYLCTFVSTDNKTTHLHSLMSILHLVSSLYNKVCPVCYTWILLH